MAPSARAASFLRFDALAAEGFETLGERPRVLLCFFFEFLPDFVAADRPVFAAGRLVAAFDAPARAFRAAGDLRDFLRVFLDIRLPFVAFRGSIIGVLRQTGDFAFFGLCSKGF